MLSLVLPTTNISQYNYILWFCLINHLANNYWLSFKSGSEDRMIGKTTHNPCLYGTYSKEINKHTHKFTIVKSTLKRQTVLIREEDRVAPGKLQGMYIWGMSGSWPDENGRAPMGRGNTICAEVCAGGMVAVLYIKKVNTNEAWSWGKEKHCEMKLKNCQGLGHIGYCKKKYFYHQFCNDRKLKYSWAQWHEG